MQRNVLTILFNLFHKKTEYPEDSEIEGLYKYPIATPQEAKEHQGNLDKIEKHIVKEEQRISGEINYGVSITRDHNFKFVLYDDPILKIQAAIFNKQSALPGTYWCHIGPLDEAQQTLIINLFEHQGWRAVWRQFYDHDNGIFKGFVFTEAENVDQELDAHCIP